MTTCLKCGYHDEFRSSRFDFEREVLERKHFENTDSEVQNILNKLALRVSMYQLRKQQKEKGLKWGYPTILEGSFAWTMTSTGSALWRMPVGTWMSRGATDKERWCPKNYFDSTNKTWTVRRNKQTPT